MRDSDPVDDVDDATGLTFTGAVPRADFGVFSFEPFCVRADYPRRQHRHCPEL